MTKTKGGPTTTYKRHIDLCVIRKSKLSGKGKGAGGLQQLLSFDSSGSGSVVPYKYDKEAILNMMAKMIMVHEYPFMMVEHELFRAYSQMLNPKFEPIGRKAIRDRAMKLYREEKATMKVMFTKVGRVSLTSDLWTSNQTKGYMCITGHFVDSDWKLQNHILNFCLLPPPHTGIAIADKMFECLSDWGLERKISTITLDNATSNDAATTCLQEQFEARDALIFGKKIFRVRCCAHILNLLVQDGLIPLKSVIQNVRESVKFILLSPSRLHKWNELVKSIGLPTNNKLILDASTRWNSTYHMLERALIFKDAFPRYASREPSYKTVPTEEEWERARDVCKFLKTFDKVTNVFSGRDYTTANLYFPEVCEIRKVLDEMANDPREFMKLMVQSMKLKFDKYWKESSLLMIVACVLDPRSKIQAIRYIFRTLYPPEEVENRIFDIKDDMQILYDNYASKEDSFFSCNMQTSSGGGSEKRSNDWRLGFESWVKVSDSEKPSRKELEVYLEESVLTGEADDFDVLGWWRLNIPKFPILGRMARDILSIPITTVPSELAFSAGRRVIGDDCCSLGDDTVEGLLFASNWFRVEYKDLVKDMDPMVID